MRPGTRVARAGTRRNASFASISTPIYQTAIFEHQRPLVEGGDPFAYSRLGNPTRTVLEETAAELEGGFRGFAFSSGMAAISAVLRLFRPGDHLIFTEGLYGHTFALMTYLLEPTGLSATFVDTSSPDAVIEAWRPNTRGIFAEVPTNPLLRVAHLPTLAEICRERNALLMVDATFLTPWVIQPLRLGADIVVHSATKYLAGHNDTMAGIAVVKSPAIAEELSFIQIMTGGILAPQDAWLTLRGIKTLGVRMDRAQENAMQLACWLKEHPKVTEVHYPGLPDHPHHEVLKSQASGFGAVISFSLSTVAEAKAVLNGTELIILAESLGGTETLMTYPWTQTHGAVPEEERRRLGLHDRLLRLAVGIEDWQDLAEDLDRALAKAG